MMKHNLTKELVKELISYDPLTGELKWKHRSEELFKSEANMRTWNKKNAGKIAFTYIDKHGYRQGRLFGMSLKAHRLIWFITYGYWPEMIDHKNGIRHDNRIKNLSEVTGRENSKNLAKNIRNTSGVSGVSFDKSKKLWHAYINFRGKRKNIGYFKSKDDAVRARLKEKEVLGFSKRHGIEDRLYPRVY